MPLLSICVASNPVTYNMLIVPKVGGTPWAIPHCRFAFGHSDPLCAAAGIESACRRRRCSHNSIRRRRRRGRLIILTARIPQLTPSIQRSLMAPDIRRRRSVSVSLSAHA